MKMKISVVVPTHRRPTALNELLESLALQDFDPEEFEVIVASNLEDPESETVVESHRSRLRNLHYFVTGIKGSNRARNKGLENACGEVAYFVDDDCVFTHPFLLKQIYQAHQEDPEVVAMGGGYLTPLHATAVERAFGMICEKWLHRRSLPDQRVYNLVGGNISYKREVLKNNNLWFNPDIEYGGAETELHARIFQAGFKMVFKPEWRLEHRARVTGPDLLRKAFLQGFSSHKRWERGLFIPSQPRAESFFEHHLPWVARWEKAFVRFFQLGQKYASWDKDNRTLTPNMSVSHLARFTGFLLTQKWRFHHRRAWSWLNAYRLLLTAKNKLKAGLPLERHYLLQDRIPLESELERAKRYGFSRVLAPASLWKEPETAEGLRQQICSHGLSPVVLIDGNLPDSALPQLDGFHFRGWDFHLLLGKTSKAQELIIQKLESWKKNWNITLLSKAERSDLKKILGLPAHLRKRVHYVFESTDSLWHPQPSSMKMARFLKRAAHAHGSEGLWVRGASGSWPSNRRVHGNENLWPLVPVRFESGNLTGPPLFSVVIPAYEAGSQLLQVVKHLLDQRTEDFEYEVIVVDDGSQFPSENMLRDFIERNPVPPGRKFKFIYWPRTEAQKSLFRAGKARNLGVTHSQGEYLCFLDSDIIVSQNYLFELKRLFEIYDVIQAKRENLTAASSAAVLGGQDLEKVKEIYPEDDYWETFKKMEDWPSARMFWKYSCTYSFSVRRKHFQEAGWFAPEFFSYGFEDVDLGYRLAKMGLKFYLNPAPVYHLYPEKKEFNFHFDLQERTRTLTLSSRVLYRLRLDPEIFAEFFPSFYQPLRGEIEAQYWKSKALLDEKYWKSRSLVESNYWKLYNFYSFALWKTKNCFLMIRILGLRLNPMNHTWRITKHFWRLKVPLWLLQKHGWRAKWFLLRCSYKIREIIMPPLMKPYHFLNYQWQTRVTPRFKNTSEELPDAPTENI